MKKLKYILMTLVVLLPLQMAYAQPDIDVNGNWWRTQNKAQHVDFLIAFSDGMVLGRNFSAWKYSLAQDKDKDAVTSLIYASYNDLAYKYMQGVTRGQMVDGLDEFYEDYRNRSIQVHDAVWLVLRQIAGETDLHLENWRKNAKY